LQLKVIDAIIKRTCFDNQKLDDELVLQYIFLFKSSYFHKVYIESIVRLLIK